jgi:uncharacterized protein (DUF1778 family)
MPQPATIDRSERRARAFRLGFRVDAETKRLVERARHESLVLSERDRAAFFDALVHAPRPNARLRRAFRSAGERVAS